MEEAQILGNRMSLSTGRGKQAGYRVGAQIGSLGKDAALENAAIIGTHFGYLLKKDAVCLHMAHPRGADQRRAVMGALLGLHG